MNTHNDILGATLDLEEAVADIERLYEDIGYIEQKKLKALAKKLTKMLERD